MSSVLLNLALLLSLGVSLVFTAAVNDVMPQVVVLPGDDCVLQCTAKHKPGVQYRAVRWYQVLQVEGETSDSGLLTKDLPNGTTRWYKDVEREVSFLDESTSIRLPNVTCGDGGVYKCHLAAPVGEQNRDGKVLLIVKDCPVATTESQMTDTYLVVFAAVLLMVAFVIFLMSYGCLKNTIKEKKTTPKKEILLNAPLKPLNKKDLMLIYTLGPKTSTMKHICV